MPNGGNSGRGPVLKECSKLSGSGNGSVSSDWPTGAAIGSFGPEPVGAVETGSTFGGTGSSIRGGAATGSAFIGSFITGRPKFDSTGNSERTGSKSGNSRGGSA